MTRKQIGWTVFSVAAFSLLLYTFNRDDQDISGRIDRLKNTGPTREINKNSIDNFNPADLDLGAVMHSGNFDQMAALLRGMFSRTIDRAVAMKEFSEMAFRYCQKNEPGAIIDCVHDLMHAAFPDRGDELFGFFEKEYKYFNWLQGNMGELNGLTKEEKRSVLWDKRYELYGKEQAEELFAGERNLDRLNSMVDELGNAELKLSFDDKVNRYTSAFDEIYGDNAEEMLVRRADENVNRFLAVSTVQTDLRNMDDSQRKEALKKVRQSMGLPDDAVNRLSELDSVRDERWSKGEDYMKRREELAGQYEGSELETRLQNLRVEFFGAELSEIIASEEESGFFRYDHERRFGLE